MRYHTPVQGSYRPRGSGSGSGSGSSSSSGSGSGSGSGREGKAKRSLRKTGKAGNFKAGKVDLVRMEVRLPLDDGITVGVVDIPLPQAASVYALPTGTDVDITAAAPVPAVPVPVPEAVAALTAFDAGGCRRLWREKRTGRPGMGTVERRPMLEGANPADRLVLSADLCS